VSVTDAPRDEARRKFRLDRTLRLGGANESTIPKRGLTLSPGETERLYRHYAVSIDDRAVVGLDPAGFVTVWNSGAERLMGYSSDQIVGAHFSRFYVAEDVLDDIPERDLRRAAAEGTLEFEAYRSRSNDTRFLARVSITPLFGDEGLLAGFAYVTRDLASDERERLDFASLSSVVRSMGDALFATDRDGKITIMNPVAESMTGWPFPEALGRPQSEVFRAVDETTGRDLDPPIEDVIRDRKSISLGVHALLLTRDGRRTPIADSAAPILDDLGGVRGAVVVFRDASAERRELRRKAVLADARALLARPFDSQGTSRALGKLLSERIADWCEVVLVHSAGELRRAAIACRGQDLGDETGHELARQHVERVVKVGKSELLAPVPCDEVFGGAREDSAKDCSLIVTPIVAGGHISGTITLVREALDPRFDAQDRALIEEIGASVGLAIRTAQSDEAEQQAHREAEAANRAKDDFLAAVTHELRNPLNSVLGWTALARAGTGRDNFAMALTTIERNARVMDRLIEDLLDLARIATGKLTLESTEVDLVDIVSDALDSARPAALSKDVELVFDRSLEVSRVRGDQVRLQQVAWNLLDNAVKFTPPGGKVDVRLREEGDVVELAVSDTGPGIGVDLMSHIFEPFKQGEPGATHRPKGLGLGLAITKTLVEAHGGNVEAWSAGPGLGATFFVRLPLSRGDADAARRPSHAGGSRPEGELALSGLNVVVVEDDVDSRELICALLEDAGAEVTPAHNVTDAFRFIEEHPPDVLLSDIGLPGRSGLDLIRDVRALPVERGGAVPAAALSAFNRPEDRSASLSAGFLIHAAKPIEPAELIHLVQVLAGRTPSPGA
jgi:PAS domain S-box-containing protein